MARRDLSELAGYLRSTKDAVFKAHTLSLLKFLSEAEALAKRNVTRNFVGRRGRKLSGRLLNSIFTRVELRSGSQLPVGIIGTRGIPYGAVHEYGNDNIRPKKAKHLWVKQWGGKADKFRRMTPREFIAAKEADPRQYSIFPSKKGNLVAAWTPTDKEVIPLFILRDRVSIPARPYIRPAIEEALNTYPQTMRQQIKQQFLGMN